MEKVLTITTVGRHWTSKAVNLHCESQKTEFCRYKNYSTPREAFQDGWALMEPPIDMADETHFEWWFKINDPKKN